MLVVRRDYDGLRRYVHLGTGNYHPVTARIYSDVGLLSTDPTIAGDVGELFNYLTTGYGAGRRFRKLLIAPAHLKAALLERIERERARGSEGMIQFKMNARGCRNHPRLVLCGAGWCTDRPLRARHVSFATGCGRCIGNGASSKHRRTLPGTCAHLLFPKRRHRRVLHRLSRFDETQPRATRGGNRARRTPCCAPVAARHARSGRLHHVRPDTGDTGRNGPMLRFLPA